MSRENPSWQSEQLHRAVRGVERRGYSLVQKNILLEAPRYHPTGYADMIAQYVGSGEYHPFLVMTHKGHAAGPMGMEEAENVRHISNTMLPPDAQLNGTLLVVAHNIENGQNEEIGDWWKLAKPIMEELNVDPVYVVRKKNKGAVGAEITEESMRNLVARYSQMVGSGQIPLLLAEGTVESGRWKENGRPGEIKGMQEVTPKSIALASQQIRRKKKIPLYIPIGTHGENRIYDPQLGKATDIAKKTAVMRAFPHKRDAYPHLMHAVVGYPVPHDVIERDLGNNGRVEPEVLDTVIGELLAALVPFNERGVYEGVPQHLHRLRTPVFNYYQAQRMYHFSL